MTDDPPPVTLDREARRVLATIDAVALVVILLALVFGRHCQ